MSRRSPRSGTRSARELPEELGASGAYFLGVLALLDAQGRVRGTLRCLRELVRFGRSSRLPQGALHFSCVRCSSRIRSPRPSPAAPRRQVQAGLDRDLAVRAAGEEELRVRAHGRAREDRAQQLRGGVSRRAL